jgi:predicted transcriptional regulator
MNAINVRRAFELRELGWTQARIADEFRVSQPAISLILRGRYWNHIGRKSEVTKGIQA